ncbi:kinase-associated lipoprotein B [Anoxybacteroides tepidamans]|uniref:kinase-associated lipoprotein B n=1 Tax=Anoxybacteroides tepidamans TaxID=265948 RepID=UPI0004805B32|nr:kinase-associated lipoprotein B [Anoxybacillus tepidamans]
MEELLKVGDIVTGLYKTGKYIGEITDIRLHHYLVKVKGVLKHPQQGDLHHPKQADVPLFHERRALAFNEQANMPKQMVRLHDGEVPDYVESLRQAVAAMKEELMADGSEWAVKSLENLRVLEKEYFGD